MTLDSGSGMFSGQRAQKGHLVRGTGGLAGEIADLRQDVVDDLAVNMAMALDEYTSEPAADVNAIKASFASAAAAQDFSGADLDGVVGTAVMDAPRNITITTSSSGDIDAVDVVITGRDVNNRALTETITLTDAGNTTDVGLSAFRTVTRVQIPAQSGTGGAIEIGFGEAVGLSKPIKVRAGLTSVAKEIVSGVELAALVHEEFVDPATADVNAIKTSIASSASIETYTGADLNGVVGEGVMSPPRNMTITTSSHVDIDAVAVVITGTNIHGDIITDIVTLTDAGNTTDVGNVAFSTVTQIVVPAQGGTSGALEFGFGSIIGFAAPVKFRNGDPQVFAENEAGTPLGYDVLGGTYTAPDAADLNGTVDPLSAPDATDDYSYSYEPLRGTVTTPAGGAPNGTYTPPVPIGGGMAWALYYEYDATLNN